jgi:hypothetical protein
MRGDSRHGNNDVCYSLFCLSGSWSSRPEPNKPDKRDKPTCLFHSAFLLLLVAGHQQPIHDFAVHDMSLHDLSDVGFRTNPVPDSLGVDHNTGSVLAVIQTPGFIRAHAPPQSEPFHLLLKKGVQALGSLVRAAAPRIALWPLVLADENVMLKCGHRLGLRRVTRRQTGRPAAPVIVE